MFSQIMNSNLNHQNLEEQRWIIQLRQILDEEEPEEELDIPVCIFDVPKSLTVTNPDCYIPQVVAIGPYHHWRPELYEMERYKLAAAKKTQKQFKSLKFHHLVDRLMRYELKIRASYHKHLTFNGETLVWMMAVDASFLLEFLHSFAQKEGNVLKSISSKMSYFVNTMGRPLHDAILRDILMLENQIPLAPLKTLMEFQFLSLELADRALLSIVRGFCKEVSPIYIIEELPNNVIVTDCAHLLDILYSLVVPKYEEEIEINGGEEQANKKGVNSCFTKFTKFLSRPLNLFHRVLFSRVVKFMLKLPWMIISNLPGVVFVKEPVEYLCFSKYKTEEGDQGNTNSNSDNSSKSTAPLMEEIVIPSVTELSNAGINFIPTNTSILSIKFDHKTATFYLPRISLDVNTEVLVRNLVAYETGKGSGPLVFTRYTELMNGIIDTENDARFLREKGIILNRLTSDQEVADLWNGMCRSVRLTKVPFLDKVIEDVNKYYNRSWKVKIGKFMKYHVFGAWELLTLLAAVLFLSLMLFNAFCSVYCRHGSQAKRKT